MFDVHGLPSVTVRAVVVLFVAGCQKTSGIVLSSKKEVEELSMTESSLTCSQLSPNCTVYWNITNMGGQVKEVGSCTGEGNCSTPFHPTVYPVRLSSTESSILTFKNVTREWAGTVTCTERLSNGSEQSVKTTVDVYYNSGDYSSRLVTHRENWTVSVIFNVTRIFSALGNYAARYTRCCGWDVLGRYREPPHFTWMPNNNQTSSGQQDHAGYFLLKTSFPVDLYCLLGDIIISPGVRPGSLPREELEKIERPLYPSASCGSIYYIPEVGPVSCSCNIKSLGRPEGRLRWLLGERVVASGGDGLRVVSLPAHFLNRSHDGRLVRCQLEWAYNLTNWLTIRMAYGPEDVIIKHCRVVSPKTNNNEVLLTAYPVSDGNVYIPPDESVLVTLGCEARNVQPWNSDMIEWGGLCQGQQGFTCNLTSRGIIDDGKKVTCTVTNHANNRQTSSASVMLKVSAALSTCQDTDDVFKKGVGIGIGATLTLVLLGFCLVLAVLWRRRVLCEGRIYDKPQPRSQDPEHIYEMTAAKDDNPGRVTEHQQPDDETDLSPPGDVYENLQTSSKTQSVTAKQQRRN